MPCDIIARSRCRSRQWRRHRIGRHGFRHDARFGRIAAARRRCGEDDRHDGIFWVEPQHGGLREAIIIGVPAPDDRIRGFEGCDQQRETGSDPAQQIDRGADQLGARKQRAIGRPQPERRQWQRERRVAPVQRCRRRLQPVHSVRQTKVANPAAGASPAMIEPVARGDQQRQDENLERPATHRPALGIEHVTDLHDLGDAAVLGDPVEVEGAGRWQAEQALPAIGNRIDAEFGRDRHAFRRRLQPFAVERIERAAGKLHAPVRQRKQRQRGKLQNGGDRNRVDNDRKRPPPEPAARKLDAVCHVRQVQTLRTRFGGSGNRPCATAGPIAILPRSG